MVRRSKEGRQREEGKRARRQKGYGTLRAEKIEAKTTR
jgi:hypothetical protein